MDKMRGLLNILAWVVFFSTLPVNTRAQGDVLTDVICSKGYVRTNIIDQFLTSNIISEKEFYEKVIATIPTCPSGTMEGYDGYTDAFFMKVFSLRPPGTENIQKYYRVSLSDGERQQWFNRNALVRNADDAVLLPINRFSYWLLRGAQGEITDNFGNAVRRIERRHVNFRDCLGYTPLYYAYSNSRLDLVEYLIQNGANIDQDVPYSVLKHSVDKKYLVPVGDGIDGFFGPAMKLDPVYTCSADSDARNIIHAYRNDGSTIPVYILIMQILQQTNSPRNERERKIIDHIADNVKEFPRNFFFELIRARAAILNIMIDSDFEAMKKMIQKGASVNPPPQGGASILSQRVRAGANSAEIRRWQELGGQL